VAKKQVILFSLMVCLPLVLLAWLGWWLARNEQEMARQRLTGWALERLENVDLVAAKYFQQRERELLKLTELGSYNPDHLRQIVRSRAGVDQLFVLDPDGALLHPDPAGTLNASEREFLLHAKGVFVDKELIRGGNTEDAAATQTTHGWHVRYWGPGLNLIFYNRLESGKVVGVLMPRSRWIADLIAELPQTAAPIEARDGIASEARICLINSNGQTVYQWGVFEPDEQRQPFAELPLCDPVSSWRLQYFIDDEKLAAVGRSAYLNLLSALAAIGVSLVVVAVYFYREYAREMREAMRRVNFVNQVSHELKTPLTSIRMYAELLQNDLEFLDLDDAERPLGHLEVVVAESQRLSRLIGNVLTFARQRRNQLSLRKTSARVDEVIAAVVERFRPGLRQKGIEVAFEAAADGPVRLDVDALEQILGNLISNVEKYAPAGGHLEIVSRQENSQTTIVVADRGPGIPAGLREKVFRPFYRLCDRLEGTTGTGIGLSIARELARLHDGDVVLLPSDVGARFQVRLHTPKVESEGDR